MIKFKHFIDHNHNGELEYKVNEWLKTENVHRILKMSGSNTYTNNKVEREVFIFYD